MKLFLLGRQGGLFPTGRLSADAVSKLSGKEVLCEVTRPRNIKLLRKYWALCHFCAEHSTLFTAEQVSNVFKMRTGHTSLSHLRDGTIVQHPGSISFAKCSEEEFQEMFNRVCDVVCTDILPGVTREDLRRELVSFLE